MKKSVRWLDLASTLLLLLWFVLPVTASVQGEALTGPALQAVFSATPETSLLGLFLLLSWLIPVFVVLRIAALFLPESLAWLSVATGWLNSALGLVTSSVLLVGTLVPFLLWGNAVPWYTTLPVTLWVVLAAGLLGNILAFLGLVESLNKTSPIFRQYQEFRREARKNSAKADGSPLARLRNIRPKLLLAFIAIIAVILLVMSNNVLSNYQKTILKAVGDGARSGAEQASSTYKSAVFGAASQDAAEITMNDFFGPLAKVNDRAAFPFQSFVFYTNVKGSEYLIDTKSGQVPTLTAEYGSLQGKFLKLDEAAKAFPPLSEDHVKAFLDPANAGGVYDALTRTYAFAGTVSINQTEKLTDGSKVRHERLLGLTVVTYDEDVILAPYVQVRTIVLILTFLFLYVAIGLVYLVGNLIVNPLLFLRMNVRNASETLESMIRGDTRVSAAALQFADTVNTRDEIKTLSGEIGNMVTVIRGIIPYISASTLKQAEKGTSLSVRKNLTFLFTDIRGFTTMSEGMSPEEVVQVLNRYLDLETEIILQNHGDVDKFVGDEMMAFFDGPDKELNACRAAMQIRKAMFEEKVAREKQGLTSVEIGIGINTGDVVFGSMGARERMDFTSIGDTVNLAARLEGANKAYSSKSMIAESVYVKVKDKFVCRELDFIAVKGKTEPVRIYEILQEKTAASAKLHEISKLFEEGLEAYRAKAWNTAADIFEKLVIEYKDGPAEVFLGRVHHFEKNPPPQDWDGVFRMDVK